MFIKRFFGLLLVVIGYTITSQAMDPNLQKPQKKNDNILQRVNTVVSAILKSGTSKIHQKIKLREAASLLFLESSTYNLLQSMIPIAKAIEQTQQAKFINNIPIQQVVSAISRNIESTENIIFPELIDDKMTLIVGDPQGISVFLLLGDFLNKAFDLDKHTHFPLFNSLLDYYKGSLNKNFERMIELIRHTQYCYQLTAFFLKLPQFFTLLSLQDGKNVSVEMEGITQQIIDLLFKELPELEEIINLTTDINTLLMTIMQKDKKLNNHYITNIDKELFVRLEKCCAKIEANQHFSVCLFDKIKKEYVRLGGIGQQWVYPKDFGPCDTTDNHLPEALHLDKPLSLFPDQNSNNNNTIVNDDASAKQAIKILMPKYQDAFQEKPKSEKKNKKNLKKHGKKHKTKEKNIQNNKEEELPKEIFEEQPECVNKEEVSKGPAEPLEQVTNEQPKNKEKKGTTNSSQNSFLPQAAQQYDARVLKWFDNSFSKKESVESVMYHSYSPIIDTYLLKYGHAEQRANATYTGQMDTVYKLVGEIMFKGKVRRHCIFHMTKDTEGICYHRGLELRPDNIFNIFGTADFWAIEPKYKTNSLSANDLKDYFEPLSLKSDEVVKETAFHVEVRDNRLGITIILYKV